MGHISSWSMPMNLLGDNMGTLGAFPFFPLKTGALSRKERDKKIKTKINTLYI
jgi:hypothetical protein